MFDDVLPQSERKQPEKNAHKPTLSRWVCPNCGQMYFCAVDDHPPDICHYCRDMTTWQPVAEDTP